MLKKLLISTLPIIILAILTSSQMNENGKAGRTGSPGELTCITCHNSYALNSGGGSISFQCMEMPTFEYTPGQTYMMSVTVARAGNSLFGVDIEALTSSNDNAGVLVITNSTSTTIKNISISGIVRHNITHTLNGGASSPNSKVFNFSWTAPASGTGNVTFYFTGAACNSSTSTSGDYIYSGSQIFTENSVCTFAPNQPGTINGNAATCNGSAQIYSVAGVNGATTYSWTLPFGWTGTSTTNNINVVAGNTTGDITVSANNSCGNSPSSTLPVTINPVVASISNNNDTLVASPGSNFEWYLNGNLIPGAVNSYYVPIQNGNYVVVVFDNSGCSGSSGIYNYVSLGVYDINNEVSQFTIYLNPVSNILFVNASDVIKNSPITIYNISGQIVQNKILHSGDNAIDLIEFTDGIYNVVIGNDSNKKSKRILVFR